MNARISKFLLVLLAGIGFVFIWAVTNRRGAGLSPDSVRYIASARNIMQGRGVVSYDDTAMVVQPPLYPALLALIGKITGADPLSFAHILSALLFGLIIYLSGQLLFKHLSPYYEFALAVTFTLLFTIPLFDIAVTASSEPLFICFVILGVRFAELHLERNERSSRTMLAVVAALASLTRYIGVTLILWGALIVVFSRRNSLRYAVPRLALFLCIATLPLCLWLIRNYRVSGTLFGPRAPSGYTIYENLAFTFNTIINWYIPWKVASLLPTILVAIAPIALLVFINQRKGGWHRLADATREHIAVISFVVIYVSFLIAASTTTAYDRIGDRLLSPVFVFVTLLLAVLIQGSVSPRRDISTATTTFILLAASAVWLVHPMGGTTRAAQSAIENGIGYNSRAWSESDTIQHLVQDRASTSNCALYSNAPDAVYILAGRLTKSSPAEKLYNSSEKIASQSELKGAWPEESNACLVWFHSVNRTHLFTLDELRAIADLETIARFDDGTIYSVTKR
jgi:hypothetical protein